MALPRKLSDIVKQIEEQTSDGDKARVMKDNSSSQLKTLIGFAVDPNVFWLLPPGTPPYRPLPQGADQEGRLWNETRRLIYFVRSPEGNGLTQLKREQMFLQLLESVDPDDAAMLVRCKNKELNISVKAVKKAFPKMTENWD